MPGWEDFIRIQVDDLIDGFAGEPEVEFISRFASPLPARVVFHILGLPAEDLPRADIWARYDGQGTRYQDPAQSEVIREALLDMSGYLVEALTSRHESPRDDMLSRWITDHVEVDGKFDLPNLAADAANLIVGGIATTGHMLASTMRLLLSHPDVVARAREDGGLLAATSTPAIFDPYDPGYRGWDRYRVLEQFREDDPPIAADSLRRTWVFRYEDVIKTLINTESLDANETDVALALGFQDGCPFHQFQQHAMIAQNQPRHTRQRKAQAYFGKHQLNR